jgi:DNA-binding Lrp family transcriptional regulator
VWGHLTGGYVRGYHAILNPKRLGFDVEAFVSVRLSAQRHDTMLKFEDEVGAVPLVRECYAVSGHADYLLRCVAPDLGAFQQFVTRLMKSRDIEKVSYSLGMGQPAVRTLTLPPA